MRSRLISGVYPGIADAILGHGDQKKSLQSLYMTISDDDLASSTGRDAVQREEYVDLDEEVELGKKSQCEKEQYVLLIISNC
jgi:hypothetical protein